MNSEIRKLKECLEKSHYTVAITGAGISFSIGVINMKKRTNTLKLLPVAAKDAAKKHPERYYKRLDEAFLHPMFHNSPSVTHKALKDLETKGMLQGIITTNIDCMHTIAGSENVAEIQGSLGKNRCTGCGREYNDYHIWNQGKMPRCENCGSPIEAFPFYSRASLEDEGLRLARTWIAQAELILIVGSNGPYGNAYFSRRKPDSEIAQINPGKTGFDDMVDYDIKRDADAVFGELMQAI